MISFNEILQKTKMPRSLIINCINNLEIVSLARGKKNERLYTEKQYKEIKKLAKYYFENYYKKRKGFQQS